MELEWSTYQIGRRPNSLEVEGLEELHTLKGRFVYVIETPPDRAVSYPEGTSHVCYIGRQGERNSGSRLVSHAKGWMAKSLVIGLIEKPYTIQVAHPRRRNMVDAYKDIEAYFIIEFEKKFGGLPLFNKNKPKELGDYEVNLNSQILRRRKGSGAIKHPSTLDKEVRE